MMLALIAAALTVGHGVEKLHLTPATSFLIEARDGKAIDVSGKGLDVQAAGVEFVSDAELGEVMRFDDAKKAQLLVPDEGKISLKDGITVEALVYLEKPIPKSGYEFLRKSVSPYWGANPVLLEFVNGDRLTLGGLHFKGEKIDYAEFEGMHKWKSKPDPTYPLPGNAMNGLYDIVTGRWTHVAFTYNRARHHLATWVDRGIDRDAFNPGREQFSELVDDDKAPMRFFQGATGLRVAQVRVASKGELVGNSDPARVYVSELAYRGYSYIHFSPVDDTIPLPVEITIENVHPPYRAPIAKYTLNDLEPHNYRIPEWPFKNVDTELVVRMSKNGRELWKYETMLINPTAASPMTWRMMRCEPYKGPSPQHPDWWIEADNTITHKGKPVFPIMTSHVTPADLDKVFDLGFTMVSLKRPDGMKTFDTTWGNIVDECCAKAAARNAWIQVGSDKNDRPGEGYLYEFDEPWGHSFALMYARYRYLRNGRQRPADLPITGGQNNWQRYRETGCVTDILAVDPYWRGGVPMRSIYYAVKCAIRDTDGLKPITLDVGNWGKHDMRPTYEELRTMSYLGVIAGCRSLYYYSWDEGPGENTAEMPDICENYKRLFGEFRALDESLTVPNVEPGPIFPDDELKGFYACAKITRKGGKTYLFVASDLYRQTTKEITFAPAAKKTAKLVSGPDAAGASAELKFDASGKAELTLPPLSCGIYVY